MMHLHRWVGVKSVFFWSSLFCALACVALCEAQNDSVTVTTYYPTPYGEYQRLRLFPTTCTTDGSCSTPGEMCFDSGTSKLLVCQGSVWSYGGNLWAMNPNTRNIYLTASGNVGIGTNNPRSKLDVRGKTDTCFQIIYHYNSSRQRCPYGTVMVQPEYQRPLDFTNVSNRDLVDSFYCCRTCYKNGTQLYMDLTGTSLNTSYLFNSSALIMPDDNANGICDE